MIDRAKNPTTKPIKMSKIGSMAVESDLGQRAMSTIQENPRLFENLGAGLNIAGAFPVVGYPFRTANKLMKNVETMVDGFGLPFYGGGKGQQGLSFAGLGT